MKQFWVMVAVFTVVFFSIGVVHGQPILKRYPGMCTDISNPINDAKPEGFIPCDWLQAGSSPSAPTYVWNSLLTPLYTTIKDWNSNLQLDVERLSVIMSGLSTDYRAQISISTMWAVRNGTEFDPVYLGVGAATDGTRIAPPNDAYFMTSPTAAANTLANPFFMQLSQDGTNAVDATHPLPVSKDLNANLTGNRIWTTNNTDQLGGSAINMNGGAKDAGTQTFVLATDDLAVLALQIIDDWDATHDSAASADGVQVMLEARSSQGTAVANGDAVRASANEYGERINAGYTYATNSERGQEVNPLSEHYDFLPIADVTDGADATFWYYIDMTGKRASAYQVTMDCDAGTVTATLHCTYEDDCAPAACNYIDKTNDVSGSANIQSTAAPVTDDWVDNSHVLGSCKYVGIKIIANTSATTGDWKISGEKHY